jgi:hypothetical protein
MMFKEMEVANSDTVGPKTVTIEYEPFLGYECIHIKDGDGMPPFTGAMRVYGTLWYGNFRPTLILSSHEYLRKMLHCIIPEKIVPTIYLKNGWRVLGFVFGEAIWTEHERCGDRVYMLNESNPKNPKLNGYYMPKLEG